MRLLLTSRRSAIWRWLALLLALACGALGQAFANQAIVHPAKPILALPLFALGGLLLAVACPWGRQ